MTALHQQLIERWRRLMAQRLQLANARSPTVIACGYLCRHIPAERLVPLRSLLLIVVHEVHVPGRLHPKLRVAGYRAHRSTSGIVWGGRQGHILEKNLSLCPQPWAAGPRLDLQQTELVDLALRLAGRLLHAYRHPHFPVRQQLELPQVWNGFALTQHVAQGNDIVDDASGHRLYRGLQLIPVTASAGDKETPLAEFADLGGFPSRQSVRLGDELPGQLVGTCHGAAFDFWSSRFLAERSGKRESHRLTQPRSTPVRLPSSVCAGPLVASVVC